MSLFYVELDLGLNKFLAGLQSVLISRYAIFAPFRLLSILFTELLLPFYGPLSGTTWVSRYWKKHSPTHTYPDHQSRVATQLENLE